MDVNCMKLLIGGDINAEVFDIVKKENTKRRVMNYNWHNDVLMFQDLVTPRFEEKDEIVNHIHEEIGHFSEQNTFVEVKKRYLWYDRIESMKRLIRKCMLC
jgi:hypothetical protein